METQMTINQIADSCRARPPAFRLMPCCPKCGKWVSRTELAQGQIECRGVDRLTGNPCRQVIVGRY
jgi:hypothetical protein